MSTFREVVYMVLDQNKLSNDDSYIEPEHVLYIISKLRAYLLSSKYKQMKAQLSNANLQTITVEMEPLSDGTCCNDNGMYVARSTTKVPNLLLLNNYEGLIKVNPNTYCHIDHFNFVDAARFPYVGYNRWVPNQTYITIDYDNYLYIKSKDSDILDLEELNVTAVFEDAEKAARLTITHNECDDTDVPCDVMDMEFPLEEGLITLLIDNAVNVIYNAMSKPQDIKNSANDELSSIVQYVNALLKDRYRKNQQQVDNE